MCRWWCLRQLYLYKLSSIPVGAWVVQPNDLNYLESKKTKYIKPEGSFSLVNQKKNTRRDNVKLIYSLTITTIYSSQQTLNCYFQPVFKFKQEIIKVREWISHMGPLTKVIPPKLFLDIVPSSSADITRELRRRCFREGFIYMNVASFVSFQSNGKPPTLLGCLLWYFDHTSKRASALGMF